uniref:Uncharacterized protein n=1 Tax=CrAss-like virus sp. ctYsL76 TaxID=2826826 RepID=A0A8S5QLY0_9CAUD|nr:MAG TPA: hypothetical protein [CrAss-like virus sp. ctYsL76]
MPRFRGRFYSHNITCLASLLVVWHFLLFLKDLAQNCPS